MHQQGVAVGRRLADRGDADGAARARTVLDHDRLVHLLRDLLQHDPPDDVVGGAGGEGNDRLDRPLRPGRRRLRRRNLRHAANNTAPARCQVRNEIGNAIIDFSRALFFLPVSPAAT